MIATHEGSVIRSTLDNIQTPQIATLVTQLAAKGKGVVRDLDPEVGFKLFFLMKFQGRFKLFENSIEKA